MFSTLISGMRTDFAGFNTLAEHFHMLANYEQPHIDRAATQAERRYHEGKHHAFMVAFDVLNTVIMQSERVAATYGAVHAATPMTPSRYIGMLETDKRSSATIAKQLLDAQTEVRRLEKLLENIDHIGDVHTDGRT